MVYALTLTGTASGSEGSPQVSKFKLTRGLIYKIEVDFPPGSSGLLHCFIEYEGVQIYPTPEGENFFGDNTIISFDDTRWVKSEPFVFDVYYWNEDDTYDHKFQIRVGLVAGEDLIRRYVPSDMVADMQEIVEKEAKEKVKESTSILQNIFNMFKGGNG